VEETKKEEERKDKRGKIKNLIMSKFTQFILPLGQFVSPRIHYASYS